MFLTFWPLKSRSYMVFSYKKRVWASINLCFELSKVSVFEISSEVKVKLAQ